MNDDITTLLIKVDSTVLDAIHDIEKYNLIYSDDCNDLHDEPDTFNFVKVNTQQPSFCL